MTNTKKKLTCGLIAGAMAVTMILPVSSMDTYAASKKKAPKAPTKVSMSVSNQNMTLKWNKGKNAKSYQVAIRTSGKGWKYMKKVKKTSANKKKYTKKMKYKVAKSGKKYKVYKYQTIYRYKTVKKSTKAKSYTYKAPKAGTYYTLAVRSMNGKKASSWKAKTAMSKVGNVTTVKGSFDSKMNLTLTWSKASGATKYEVYRLTDDGKKYELIGSTTKTSFTTTRYNPTQDVKVKILPVAGSAKGSYSAILTLKPQDVTAPHKVTKTVDQVKCAVCGEDITALSEAEKQEKHGISYYCSVCGESVISHNKTDIEKHIQEKHSVATQDADTEVATVLEKTGVAEEKTGQQTTVNTTETKAHTYKMDSTDKYVTTGYNEMTVWATRCYAAKAKDGKLLKDKNGDPIRCNKDLTEWGERSDLIMGKWWKENIDPSVNLHIKNNGSYDYISDYNSWNASEDKWRANHSGQVVGEAYPDDIFYNEWHNKELAHYYEDEAKGWWDCGRTMNQYETRRFPITKKVPEKVYTCTDCGAVVDNY